MKKFEAEQFELLKFCAYCNEEHPYNYNCPIKNNKIGELQIKIFSY